MKHWWVNHKKTWKQEVEGGYLWSPKTENGERNSEFYNNMRRASPGDTVFSNADTRIRRIGIVTGYALTAPIPGEFPDSGNVWAKTGWRLPVSWMRSDLNFIPKNHIEQIRTLLPKKYSPIRSETGYGNQKAYLSKIEKRLYQYVLGQTGWKEEDVESFAESAGFDDGKETLEDEIQSNVDADESILETEKLELRKARRGQGKFRKNVSQFEESCRVTGVGFGAMLTASHIKPWAVCSNSTERLDGENGLLLAPHIDRLFDRGFISFDESGRITVSSRLPKGLPDALGIPNLDGLKCGSFTSKQHEYLQFHRENVFLTTPPDINKGKE